MTSEQPTPRPDAAEQRIAALEEQVAALAARLAPPPSVTAEPPAYGRRDLLRRGTAVLAAGVAGAVALPSAVLAAEGDPLLAGRTTDTGPLPTGLVGGGPADATLVLTNPSTGSAGAAPTLRLTPSSSADGLDPATAQAGDLASSGELLHYAHTAATGAASAVTGTVYTSAFANHLAFLSEPRRVLDTRPGTTGGGNDRRSRVVAGRFDSSGRLVARSSLVLDLSELVVGGVGVFANLTVATPAAAGFLTLYPTPDGEPRTDGLDRPASSSLNYAAGTPSLANFAVVALGAGSRLTVFTTAAAHVLLDLSAFTVAEPFALTEPGQVTGALRQGAARRR